MKTNPVSFDFCGQTVTTFLRPFHEQDPDTFYMGDGMKYFGRLHKMNDEYVFLPFFGCEELTELTDFFYDVVVAWYE